MLQLFRNNSPFTVIVLFIFALLVKFPVLLHPVLPVAVPSHFLYNYVLKSLYLVFGKGAFGFTMLAIVVIFAQALYLKSITTRHKMFQRYTYVPAFVFLLLTSIYPSFSGFNETLIVNWFLMGAADMMFSFSQTTHPRKLIFNASFLLSMAALFQFTMLAYFFLLLVGMVLFRSFSLGEWCVALMGYITPFYFLISILFLLDRFGVMHVWPHIGSVLTAPVSSPFHLIVTILGLVILLVLGIYAMQQNVAMSNIYVRRDWIGVSFYLIISLVVALLTDGTVLSAWLVAIPALSIIISHALLLEKNKRFSNFIFYFSVFFLVFCLMANK